MSTQPTEFLIDAFFPDRDLLEVELRAQNGSIGEPIRLAEGVTLAPLFLSVRTSHAVGTPELLTFVVTVSSSVTAKIVAEFIYKWFSKTKAERLRVERDEMVIQDGPEHFLRVVHEILDKGPRP